MQIDIGIADQFADVVGLRVPLERQFEAEHVAVESDRALERFHRKAGVMRFGDFCQFHLRRFDYRG